jgi:hypothetical protein
MAHVMHVVAVQRWGALRRGRGWRRGRSGTRRAGLRRRPSISRRATSSGALRCMRCPGHRPPQIQSPFVAALACRWGVMGDWDHAYVTMSPAYEARQIEVFAKMYMDGMRGISNQASAALSFRLLLYGMPMAQWNGCMLRANPIRPHLPGLQARLLVHVIAHRPGRGRARVPGRPRERLGLRQGT